MEEFIELFDGAHVPLIGWTSYQNDRDKMEKSIDDALSAGCRHISTDYTANEDVLGTVLNKWFSRDKLKREDIFISAKLPCIGNTLRRTEYFLRKSLQHLCLDYVDMYSISSPVGFTYTHDENVFPFTNDEQVDLDRHTDLISIWKGMELLVDAGLTKYIGVANFNSKQLKMVIRNARIPPAVLEVVTICQATKLIVECHAFFQQQELRELCQRFEVPVASFLPFGFTGKEGIFSQLLQHGYWKPKVNYFDCPTKNGIIVKYSVCYNKSPEQILIRFLIQNGILVIVNTPKFKQEYLQCFNFELTDDEMKSIMMLDKGRKGRTFIFAHIFNGFDTHPENPFQDPF